MKGDPIVNFFPNLIFKLIRSPNLNSNQLSFRIPKSMNKFEIKDYLTKVYKLPITDVRTMNYAGAVNPKAPNRRKQPDFKKTIVTVEGLCWRYPKYEKPKTTEEPSSA